MAEIGICGYELNNPDVEMFETRILEVQGYCKDCPFMGSCLTPCESVRCLTPREGQLVNLGRERSGDGDKITYYALIQDERTRFVQVHEPDHRWAKACCIDREQVPNWALSQLSPKPRAEQS